MSEEIEIHHIFRFLKTKTNFIIFCFIGLFLGSLSIISLERIFFPIFRGSFTLLISDPIAKEPDQLKRNKFFIDFEDLAKERLDNDIPTLVEFLKSSASISEIAAKKNLSRKALSNKIKIQVGGVDLKARTKSFESADGILKVFVFDKNKDVALDLLQNISRRYLEVSLSQKQEKFKRAIDFLDKQEPILKKKVNDIQTEILKLREKNGFLEPLTDGASLKEREIKIEQELNTLFFEKEKIKNIQKQIENGKLLTLGLIDSVGKDFVSAPGLIINNYDKSLINEIILVKKQLSESRSKFTEKSQKVIALKKRLNNLKPLLEESQKEATNTAINLININIEEKEKQISELRNSFQKNPSLIKKFDSLNLNLKIANDNLSGLTSTREYFQLKINQSNFPWKIIEPPAMDEVLYSPNLSRQIPLAIIVSVFGSFLITLILRNIKKVFDDDNHLKEQLNIETISDLPFFKILSDLTLDKYEKFRKIIKNNKKELSSNLDFLILQEEFRKLINKIYFNKSKKNLKIINVTSTINTEGKSIITILISKFLSDLGFKVLVIDGDMRFPFLHKILDLKNERGLSEILSENQLNWKDYIISIYNQKNLFLITAGNKNEDPPILLNSSNLDNLIEDLKTSKEFDYILVDSPGLLGLSDTHTLINKIDNVLLIVSLNFVEIFSVKKAINLLSNTNCNLIGIISNKNCINRGSIFKNEYLYSFKKENKYIDTKKTIFKNLKQKINNSLKDFFDLFNKFRK